MSDIERDAELLQPTSDPNEMNPELIDQPEDQPEVSAQPEEQAHVPFYRKKAFQLMGGAVLVGGAFGVGLSMGESENNTPQAEAEDTEDAQDEDVVINPDDSDTHEDSNVIENSDDTETEVSAEIENEYTPILMDAKNPADLVEQQQQNYDCIFNAPVYEAQLECVRYVVGDGRSGDLSTQLRGIARQASSLRESQDPDWTYESTYEIMDSSHPLDHEFTPNDFEAEFIVKINEYDTEIYKRYKFARTIASEVTESVDSVDVEVNEQLVWVLRSDRSVDPNTRITIN